MIGEFTAPVRNALIGFVGADLNIRVIAIGPNVPVSPPVAAGTVLTVQIPTSGGI